MEFKIHQSTEILKTTPFILEQFLGGLSQNWLYNNEGKDTWSPYDIMGHLIYGEQTDWIVRIKIILSNNKNKRFEPFDRFAQMTTKNDKSINELLLEFKKLRLKNLDILNSLTINETNLKSTGFHPEFGLVTLQQLISSWVVHDLGHIAQISRVMAKQYKNSVGPWINYLNVLNR
ncbi:MAG: DinB family protein [Winogradskyella sp.]|uniref:DinB family protein n=1 Tax=Winogradskyella sp. TaxID=1883156 RepID=UPI001803EB28|nr:DinB family protein [Winogradskyella sp.]